MNRTLEQYRAQYGLHFIQTLRKNGPADGEKPEINDKFREKINTLIQKAPVQIMQNGLGQLLAFLLADNEGKEGQYREPAGFFYDHLAKWLCGPADESHPSRIYDESDLIEQLCTSDRRQYVRAQREALLLLSWTKKFSAAWLAG